MEPKLNFNRLKKDEILWLYNHYCKHGHRYTEHLPCYFKEKKEDSSLYEKIGFLDIESGGSLTADFGYIFSYCIKEQNGKLIKNILTPKEIKDNTFDKRLIGDFIKDVRNFDRLVVYWGKDRRHDLPFLRTRAVKYDLSFPAYKEITIIDVYDIVKGKFRLYRNRMENACEMFGIPSKGHRLNPEVWQRALAGNKKALDYILEHNVEDVISLELLFNKINQFSPLTKSSI